MTTIQPLVFSEEDLKLREVPLTLGDRHYLIQEATGDIACKYRNALLKRTTIGPEGKPSKLEGIADVNPLLIHWCLVEMTTTPEGLEKNIGPVPLDEIRGWKPGILKEIINVIEAISDLDDKEEDEEEVKN